MSKRRSLYCCLNAKTWPNLHCEKGYYLGQVTILSLARGAPLHMAICQICLDYDEMGEPVSKADRGWR